jgi:hypothetical protein
MYGPDQLAANLARPAEIVAAVEPTKQEQVRQPTLEEALAQIPAEDNPFDAACMELMSRVAAFFGECASTPDFSGVSIDEMRDGDGKLLSLRLVPTDLVNDEPVRRVSR